MSNILTHENGNIIAFWGRKPSEQEEFAFVGSIRKAIYDFGIDANVKLIPACGLHILGAHFGYAETKVVLTLNNPPKAIRSSWNRSIVKGLTRITFSFRKTAGMFNIEDHKERDRILDNAFATMPKEEAFDYCDALNWDGDIYEYKAITDGKQRPYRGRTWWNYEGRTWIKGECGHYGYGNLAEIQERIDRYISAIATDLNLLRERKYETSAA